MPEAGWRDWGSQLEPEQRSKALGERLPYSSKALGEKLPYSSQLSPLGCLGEAPQKTSQSLTPLKPEESPGDPSPVSHPASSLQQLHSQFQGPVPQPEGAAALSLFLGKHSRDVLVG